MFIPFKIFELSGKIVIDSTLPNLVPRVFPLGKKDPGGRWSRDLLKSSRFLINYLGFLYKSIQNANC
jgi:hypothetical protein